MVTWVRLLWLNPPSAVVCGQTRMTNEMGSKRQAEHLRELELLQQIDITEAVKNSPVFARLVEEVRVEEISGRQSYNRMHNRHNRSR